MSAATSINVLFYPVGEPPRVIRISKGLDAMYRLLNTDTVDMVWLEKHTALVCSDTGRLDGLRPNVWVNGGPIHGPCLIVSTTPAGGMRSLSTAKIDRCSSLPRFKGFEPGKGLVFE